MKKKCIDLNSDMGEGFGAWQISEGVDEALIPLISSANIATGFHAGDPNIMSRIVQMAKLHGVGIGAHPSFRDLVGFGRRHISASAQELVNDMVYQLGALREFTLLHRVPMQHIKPHGALYMHAARDQELSLLLIQALQQIDPAMYLFCIEQSVTYGLAKKFGQPVVREFYGDRDYDRTGSIVFTRRVGRPDPAQVAQKVLRACMEGKVETVDGGEIDVDFDSVCIHSDTPGAVDLITETRAALLANGIRICPIPEVLRAAA